MWNRLQISTAAALAASVFLSFAAPADGATNDLLEAESAIRLPTLEASIYYSTAKIEYGMVENDESVFGYEAVLEWYGVFGGIDACYDMTDVNGRKGRYNEIESFLGYGFTYGDFTARAAYVYKALGLQEDDEKDTQEVELELEYETPWVTPFVELILDTHFRPGALYGVVGLARVWELTDGLSLVTSADVGFGNPYHNDICFDCDCWAFREMHLCAELEIDLCPHLKLVPSIDLYDAFTKYQRDCYDKFNGFIAVAGCRLAADF